MASPRTRPQERRRAPRRGQATHLNDAAQPLRQTDNWFRRFAEASFEGLVIHENGVILDANQVAAETIGYARSELLGRHAQELIAPESQDSLQRALISPSDAPIEAVCVRKDGSTFPVEIRGRPISYDGRTARVASIRDVTDRKRAEEALRESEERYSTLFERTGNPILVIDTAGNYVACNEAALAFLECTQDELLAKNVSDFVPPGKEQQVVERHAPLWSRGGTVEAEYYVRGAVKTLQLTITPAVWQGKKVVFGVGTDVSERKRTEEALQRAREELEDRVERQIQRGDNYGLTFRELTVLHLVAAGNSDRDIGAQLAISPLTARKHVEHILAKMDSTCRTEASVRALREGLLD